MRTLTIVASLLLACSCKKDDAPAARGAVSSQGSEVVAPSAAAQHTPATAVDPAKVTAFWKWFAANAGALRKAELVDAMNTISAELAKIDAGVFGEIGAAGDQRTLVLSADGNKALFPIVEQLHAARPTVAGWTVVKFRQRDTPDSGFALELGGKKIEPKQLKFVAEPAGGKLDVTLFIPGFTTNEQMGQLGFLLLDHTVGEYDMETKIGGVDFAPLSKAPAHAKPLTQLPAMVDALK